MSINNICNYTPLSTISGREIDRRFNRVHRSLCYVEGVIGGGPFVLLNADNTITGVNTFTQTVTAPLYQGGTYYPTRLTTLDLSGSSGFSSTIFKFGGTTASILLGSLGGFAFVQSLNFANGLYLNAFGTGNVAIDAPAGSIILSKNNVQYMVVGGTGGNVVIKAGTTTLAPIVLTAGTNLTTPVNGALEFDGTNLYFTVGGVRKTVTLT